MIADILLEVVLPVFVLIAVGSLMQRAFNLDLYTLSKINFYFITPAAVFMSMYLSEMSGKLLGTIVFFIFCMHSFYILSGPSSPNPLNSAKV